MDSTSSFDNGRWFEDGDESNTDMVSALCFQKTVVTSSHAQMCLDPLIKSCSLIDLFVVL